MTICKVRAFVSMIGAVALLASPATASAKSLCLMTNYQNREVVIPKFKMKAGSTASFNGYVTMNGTAQALSGDVLVSSEGLHYQFTMRYASSVIYTTNGYGWGDEPESTITAIFYQPDKSLDLGDVGNGAVAGNYASSTVVDCATAPPIP